MREKNKKEIIDNWIEEIMVWRREAPSIENVRDGDNPSIDIYIKEVRKATEKGDTEHAWKYIERLKRLVGDEGYNKMAMMNPTIKDRRPEIVLECALAAYRLQDVREAKNLLRDAGGIFHPYSLERAFALWLRGCFLWVPPLKIGEAIFYWVESLKKLREINHRKDFRGSQKEWFSRLDAQMEEAIKIAAKKEYPPLPSEVRRDKSVNKESPVELFVASIPVVGEIPAGYPAGYSASLFSDIDSTLEFHDIYLDGRKYEVFSVTDKKVVELKGANDYYMLRVIGDSMNESKPIKILSGNYVLIKKQTIADNGDIVAAEIVAHDNRATLKRYYQKGGKYILQSESNITDFKLTIDSEYEYEKWGSKVLLRGVVVAVLKPA